MTANLDARLKRLENKKKRDIEEKRNKSRSEKLKGNKNAVGNPGPPKDKLTFPEIYTIEYIEKEATAFKEWLQKPDSYFFTAFATERGYCIQRLTEFAKKSSVFSDVLKFARDSQHTKLVLGGLKNETNAGITKFVLMNHHNYTEKNQVSGDAANPISFLLDSTSNRSKELTTYKENDAD
jgi:hypothetical protein